MPDLPGLTADPRRYIRAMTLIRARIADGTFKPGELMPPIAALNAQTGYSRHTLSKALALLERDGAVTRTPGLGYSALPIHQEGTEQ